MKKILVTLAFCFLFLFGLLSKYEDRSFMRNVDFAVTVKVQERIDNSLHLRLKSFVDSVMEGATFFAAPGFSTVVVLLCTGVLFYDRKTKKVRWKALVIPLAFLCVVAGEILGKSIVHHPSPPFSMIKHTTSIFPANYINEQYSYPSGHAARAVFLAIIAFSLQLLAFRKRSLMGITLGLYVLLVCISRIYLGHHWFSDVLGGIFLGSALSCTVVGFLYDRTYA
jgi:membrane-associated phospholipid phosphatase